MKNFRFKFLIKGLFLIFLLGGGVELTENIQAAEVAGHPSQLLDPGGLDDPLLRWNASLITVEGEPDMAGRRVSGVGEYLWDFSNDDFDGITRFSEGIINPGVKDGKLSFKVGEAPFFYWGDHFNDPGVPGLQIGVGWPVKSAMDRWHNWVVKIRLKQTMPESEWTISARRAGSPSELDSQKVKIEGTEWQDIAVEFSFGNLGINNPGIRRHSLCIEPGGNGNEVLIDQVRVMRLDERQYIRKSFNLNRRVLSAHVCVIPIFDHVLYINGRQVERGVMYGAVDVTEYFQLGENIIAYEDYANFRGGQDSALEGCLIFEDGTFQRIWTDGDWKGALVFEDGWNMPGFDDSLWVNVKEGRNVGKSNLTIQRFKDKDGHPRARGYGVMLDPPYFGPIGVFYPDKDTPEDTPAFFPVGSAVRVNWSLPERGDSGAYRLEYELLDAFTGEKINSGILQSSSADKDFRLYSHELHPENPGVYNLVTTACWDDEILDRRFDEFAIIGKISQREVPWRDVTNALRKNLIAEIKCGDVDAPFEYIEHPGKNYQKNMQLPLAPMTEIESKDERQYRVLSDAFGDWIAWKIPMPNPHLPHILEVEYPDDRAQNFAAYVRDRPLYYNRSYGNQDARRGAVWCLNDPGVLPLTGEIEMASFVFYPQSLYPYLSVELMNMFNDGRRSAVYRVRVYEITGELPAPEIKNRQEGRWFGSQTERAGLMAATYYNGFFNNDDAKLFANLHRCRLNRYHGFVRDWYLTYANMIRRMRFAGENMFMCGFWMYDAPYWAGSELGRRSATQNYDNFALLFAMFGANDMFLMPWIEYVFSYQMKELNRYTDKEVAEGAPTTLVVGRDGRQGVFSGAGANSLSIFDPRVQEDLLNIVRELGKRYGRYKGFKGVGFGAGGFCLPSLYNNPRALDWQENLEWGWEDDAIRMFTEMTGIDIPVDFDDPERFARRYNWVMDNARTQWIEFRKQALVNMHKALAEEVQKISDDADYYPFLWITGQNLMREVVLSHQDISEQLEIAGIDVTPLKQTDNLNLGWVYRPESFVAKSPGRIPAGLFKTFNNMDIVNETLDQGDSTACFIDPIWSEPDYGNFLHKDWVWTGHEQNNPNAWYSGLHYPTPFTDRLSQMTPGMIGFGLTDGLLYTAQNCARRPIGVAYQSIPKGEYARLEGNGLERNIVVCESVNGNKRSFYVVNPAWWDVQTVLRLSGKTIVKDLVDDVFFDGAEIDLSLGAYEVRVFQMPHDITVVDAETVISADAAQFVKSQLECFDYLDKLGCKKTLRQFSLPEPLDVSMMRLDRLRRMADSGDYLEAQKLLYHPWVIRVMDFLREKQKIDAAGGVKIMNVYRVNVGASESYSDSMGREWLPDQDFNYGVFAYGYLDSEPGSSIYRGSERAIKGTDDPEIYRYERFQHSGHAFRVPDGSYTVYIHYVESFRHRPDLAATDSGIQVNGRDVFPNFNLGNEAGGLDMAFVKTVTGVQPVDGKIEIRFSDPLAGRRYHGLEIIRE